MQSYRSPVFGVATGERRELCSPVGAFLVRVQGLQAPLDETREAPAILSLQVECSDGTTLGPALAARPGLEPYVFKSADGFAAFGCTVRKSRGLLGRESGSVATLSFAAPAGPEDEAAASTAPPPPLHATQTFACSGPARLTGLTVWFAPDGGALCGVQVRAGFADEGELARLQDRAAAEPEPEPEPAAAPPAAPAPDAPLAWLAAVAAEVRPLVPGRVGALLEGPGSDGWFDNLVVVLLALVALAAAGWFLTSTFRARPQEKRGRPRTNPRRPSTWTTDTSPWP